MQLLLASVVKNLKTLSSLGLSLSTPEGTKTIRGKLLLGIFDMPAKAAVLNMKQFNGAYGCPTCLHEGTHQRGAQIYLPQTCRERTNDKVHECAQKAERSGNAVHGIKGHSILSGVFDVTNCVPVDYMHAVLEGVTRWFLHSWFDSKHHAQPFYLGRYLQAIDKDLMQQHPPHEISRSPRSIAKHINYWKASELRSWLLYYSLPLILKYLPALYFHHFSLLVCAIHILLQDSLSDKMICAAEQMITDFFNLLPELYGNRSCTANAHSLNHLCKFVRLWGPMWTHSAFGYESKNGHLKNMFHAKSSVVDQLVFAADISLTLSLVQSSLEEKENEVALKFIEKMTGYAPLSNMIQLEEHVYAIGRIKKTTLPQEESSLLQQETAQIFGRAFSNSCLYYRQLYCTREHKRNDVTCTYYSGNLRRFGEIQKFVHLPEPMAIVREFDAFPQSILKLAGHPCRQVLGDYARVDLLSGYIYALNSNPSKTVAIPVKKLQGKAVLITPAPSVCVYAIKQPNNFEHH
jgi:hypothetical protein